MTSLEIYTFKETIKSFIDKQTMPKIVISMVLKELSMEAEKSSVEEIISQVKEQENVKS